MDFLNKTRFCTLVITNACNLQCRYCFEENKNSDKMSLELAMRIVESELSSNNLHSNIQFLFFGGEPFLEFETMRKIVESVKNKFPKKSWHFGIATNGTLLNEEHKIWLLENKPYVTCYLSLDGTRDVHNAERSNSFDLIDLKFFSDNYPNAPIKITLTQNTLPYLFESVKFCIDSGFKVAWNLAHGVPWDKFENKNILSVELKKLIDYYLANPDVEPDITMSETVGKIAYQKPKGGIFSLCAAGRDMIAYDTFGEKYPCQYFAPISVGKKAVTLEKIEIPEIISDTSLDDKCQHCVVRSICPTCYAENYYKRGNLYKRCEQECELLKLIIKAKAYFFAERWKRKMLTLSKEEEKALLEAIMTIQTQL